MAIQIRRKEEEKNVQVLEPDVLPPEGSEESSPSIDDAIRQQTKAQTPGMEDKFVMRSGSAMAWLMEHRRMVLLITIIILVIAFGWIGTQKFKESTATDHSTAVLSDAFVTYTALTKDTADKIEQERTAYLKSQGIAAEADDILHFSYTVPNDHARFVAIEKHLDSVIPQHAGTPIETSASLMLAGTKSKLHSAADTLPTYIKAETSENADVQLFGALGEAEMLIGESKFDDAIKKLDEIAAKNPSFTAYALLEKGRIFEIKGDTTNAIAAYDQLIRETGETIAQQRALSRLRVLTPDWNERLKALTPEPAPQAAL